MVLVGLGSYLEAVGKNPLQIHSGCWQEADLCGCRSEVLVSFRAVSQRLLSAPKTTYISSHIVPSISRTSNDASTPSHIESLFLFPSQLEKFSAFKGLTYLHQVHPGNPPFD